MEKSKQLLASIAGLCIWIAFSCAKTKVPNESKPSAADEDEATIHPDEEESTEVSVSVGSVSIPANAFDEIVNMRLRVATESVLREAFGISDSVAVATGMNFSEMGTAGSTVSSTTIPVNSAKSNLLKITGFGFTVTGANSIFGVRVRIHRGIAAAGTVRDDDVKLVIGGTVTGDDKADTVAEWPPVSSGLSTVYYGSDGTTADTWGINGLTVPNVTSNANFGFAISGINSAGSQANTLVDYCAMTVFFQ